MQQTYHKGLHFLPLNDHDGSPTSTAAHQSSPTSEKPPARPDASSSVGGHSAPATQPSGSTSDLSSPPVDNPPSPPANTPSPPASTPSSPVNDPPPPPPPTSPSGGGDDDGATGGDDGGSSKGGPGGGSTGNGGSGSGKGSGKTAGDNDNDADDNHGGQRRTVHLPRLDSDDPGFVDTPVSAEFNFTGIAVYIFCIQPLGVVTGVPSLMNVSFSLDGAPASTFVHQGSPSDSGFLSGVNAFAKNGLADGPHTLKLSLAPNSVFILDYMLITQTVAATPSSTGIPVQSRVASPSPAPGDNGTTKKDRDTFAAALASSLGVLGILCFGTAFSIYRRRQLAARRERLERENAPPLAPMSGPVPFIPRYFPGTVVHSVPPPYAPSNTSSSSSLSALAAISEPLLAHTGTYVDFPPPLDEIAPPSFGDAITTPAVTFLSSHDVAVPPPRPESWGADPGMVPLPPSITSLSRSASLASAGDEDA
ncbi:hypothetical protein B0H16DRAFT_1724896 [Mycena metata]|uniref:Uncharacterized protein n=1 Tax=Mycena metata TaxID=1033252 RepID=A0AAD7N845_9AGAR|nr:hypothetical protein B0H16DRAFT_1724896 [Mycena metata]